MCADEYTAYVEGTAGGDTRGSINGSGHLVVGSIKFVGGLRKKVLAKLAEKMG